MQQALIFVSVYFFARIVFYDINRILYNSVPVKSRILGRIILGALFFLLIPDLRLAIIYFLLHSLLALADTFLIFKSEAKKPLSYGLHLVLLLLILSLSGVIESAVLFNPGNPLFILPESSEAVHFWLLLAGYLFTIKEGTVLIRMALNRLSTVPIKEEKDQVTDAAEYERGKWIGILERTFIFFLIVLDQVGAIALIIALKSLARFNELNKKSFAEYFLIGSLLSLLVASIPAILVRLLW